MTDSTTPLPEEEAEPTGHYGPGYGDPTDVAPDADPLRDAPVDQAPATAPSITSDEVESRPPDRAPAQSAPASTNVGLTFERS